MEYKNYFSINSKENVSYEYLINVCSVYAKLLKLPTEQAYRDAAQVSCLGNSMAISPTTK
jgi:hypothetical protein